MPHFSVVIPTFNRAHLLPMAIESVLQQTCEDFEIVVSNGGSTDETAKIIRRFSDPRVKYTEAPTRLTVGENYQQGLDHATGEYITFLSDDDAYTPDLLAKVKSVIEETGCEIVGYQFCRYYHDDIYDFEIDIPKNSLLVSKFDSSLSRFTAIEALEQVKALHGLNSTPVDARFICPYLSNATYHRRIFDDLNNKRPNLFDMVPADIYLAAAVFFEVDAYYCLDEPLLVWSNWEGNSTATAQRSEQKVIEHYKRLLNGRQLEHTPLKFAVALNCGANAVLEAIHDLDRDSGQIDWVDYFAKTYENLIFLQSSGMDTSEQEKEFSEVLSQQPLHIRKGVDLRLSNKVFRAKAFLNARMPRVAASLRRILGRPGSSEYKVIEGSSAGFSNVVEASNHVV